MKYVGSAKCELSTLYVTTRADAAPFVATSSLMPTRPTETFARARRGGEIRATPTREQRESADGDDASDGGRARATRVSARARRSPRIKL